ncbi:hypothetical protein KKB44_02125 [Candidatus Micrarchaeota archaeon]|nr:hypothetical protein [Candidatus Micrarchaeota archaeon]
MNEETQRQIFHIILGIVTIAILLYYSKGFMIAAVFFTIIAGTIVINMRLLKKKIAFVQWFEKHFERKNIWFPGWGSACYAAGVLIPLTFLTNNAEIAAIIFMLAVGDGFSTLIGRIGKTKLPYNKKKTLEGTVAFFVATLPAYYFVGSLIVPLAIIGAIVESIDLKIDDNLTIPIAGTAFLLVV